MSYSGPGNLFFAATLKASKAEESLRQVGLTGSMALTKAWPPMSYRGIVKSHATERVNDVDLVVMGPPSKPSGPLAVDEASINLADCNFLTGRTELPHATQENDCGPSTPAHRKSPRWASKWQAGQDERRPRQGTLP
jgi:hypothetical protein